MAYQTDKVERADRTYQQFISGWFAGITAVITSHPFDTYKTYIQQNKVMPDYKLRTLYRGLSAPLLGVGFEKAVVFGIYESTITHTSKWCKNIYGDNMYALIASNAMSGGLSGMCASFIVTPFERIKILLQTGPNTTTALPNTALNTASAPNVRSIFQGLSATFYRETPGFAIYFSTYNYLKYKYEQDNRKKLGLVNSFIYGGLAGTTSWLFIYPQDRIKTKIQALRDTHMSFKEGFNEIVKKEGITGLYKGFSYALLRAIPLHATAFMTMELCKKWF
jgi:solute carrier family 25 carnitine/acylcarnitine transporter 20/29